MQISDIPHVMAILNGISVIFLTIAYIQIKKGEIQNHKTSMIGALVASAIFLIFYVYYKANSGFAKFGGDGSIRYFYFTLLITHLIGAIIITGIVPITVWKAIKGNFKQHKWIARYTWPLWMWVGLSGIVVYIMTIHLFPYKGS